MEFWWNNMLTLQKVLFIVACATTLIMVIQIILMLVGAGSNGFEAADGDLVGGADFDGDADFDGGSDIAQSDLGAFGMKLLGIRSIMAFLCIFSWVGYTCVYLMDWWWALLIGVGAGVAGVAACCVAHDSRRKDSDRRHDKHTPCNRLQQRKFICAYPPSAAVREKSMLSCRKKWLRSTP